MLNIEKEFYKRIEDKFSECKSVAFHLAEFGVLTTNKMEQYIIKDDFKKMKAEGKTSRNIYFELSEKYCKEFDSIRYIVERV